MSIFNNTKTPVHSIRSLFFLMAAVCCIANFFPMISYANEASQIEGVSAEGSAEETATEDSTEDTEVEEEQTVIFSQNIYHKHTGSSSGGGGCYTVKKTKKETVETDCGGSMVYWPETNSSQCDRCGAGYSGDQSGRRCWATDYETVEVTYYELGCKQTPKTLLGTLSVTQSTKEWTKHLTLTGSYEIIGKMKVSDKPFIWNKEAATDCNTYEVDSNGDYTLRLNANSNANTAAAIVTARVRNIDVTAPTVRAHTQEPQADWTRDGVVVTITDIADLQPDGSEGCGLHEQPYSYDNGVTWTVENTHVYMENGAHTILVRDKLENMTEYSLAFSNVDVTAPTILTVEYDDTKNIRRTALAIMAEDLQPDGSAGVGLHELAYSYDRGKTWTADNSLLIEKSRTVGIAVRDKLENIQYLDVNITNIDSMGPEVFYELEPSGWTKHDVALKLWAKDINADGSQGVGLADKWYSLDGGNTWSDMEELVYEENQKLTIIARDKHNNRSKVNVNIKNIDKVDPWVSLSKNVTGSGADIQVLLTAEAGDNESGLHEEPYSWDKGCSYGTSNTLTVTENGTYQVTVRDKAGNWRYALCEVDVFPIIEIPASTVEETTEEEEESALPTEEESMEESEEETQTYVVEMDEKIEAPKNGVVQTIEEDGCDIVDTLLLLCLLLLLIGLLLFLLLLWFRTIAVYAEDMDGNMKYMGRRWMDYKDERYEVRIGMELMEKCETTHFELRPSALFVRLHEDKDICCLFPEDICIIKKIEKQIDVLLL